MRRASAAALAAALRSGERWPRAGLALLDIADWCSRFMRQMLSRRQEKVCANLKRW
jgi:hypothetical protein